LSASAPFVQQAARSSLLRELLADKAATAGAAIIATIVFLSLFAPLIAPHDPAAQNLAMRLAPPVWIQGGSWQHVLGTDSLGRDVLSRVMHGGQVTLLIGLATTVIAMAIGVVVGLWAGYAGGRADSILMRLVDIQVSFPGILLILLIVAVIGPGTLTMIIVLSVTNWMVYARLVRSTVMSLRQSPYVEAAEIVGCRPGRVIFVHILPNLIPPLLTLSILEFTNIVLAEAAVSFLGFGVQPPAVSWGLDVATGRDYLFIAWWLVAFPGLAIVLTVLSINLFANWVRATSDPQEREKRFARDLARAERRGAR
jgi:peptide/nickel transport system permease protein